ncbi:methyl-accepting chemotaxis protein [Methanoculleus caldifontis]|nr:methyl-accepting chemotaxis protein [Methanoculleus sp. Wushi-C6]
MSEGEILDTLTRLRNGDLNARIDEEQVDPGMRPLAEMINATIERFRRQFEESAAVQAEAAALKRQFTQMIRDNPLAIAVLRADRSRIEINDEYARMWRGTREETLAKKLYDYDITVLDGEHFYACYETKKRARTNVLAKWPDGVKKYLALNAIPILDEKGEIEMAFYVWNDWTELHDRMEETGKAQARMDTMIRDNPLAIAILNRDRHRIEINRAYEAVWHGTRDELLNKNLSDFKPEILSGDGFYATFDEQRRMSNEFSVTLTDGTKKTLQLHGIPIFDEAGSVEMAFYIYVDVTEQRKKEGEVLQVMKDTGEVLDALETVPVMKIDRDFTVQMINKAGAALIDRKPADVVGMKCYDIFKTDHCRTPECRCARAMQSRRMERGEAVARPSGKEIPIMYDGTPLFDEKGSVVGAVEYVVDLTEVREKERQVQILMDEAQEKAKSLDRSVQDLAMALAAVAKGDLTRVVAIGEDDPLAKVKGDFNSAIGTIAAAIKEINRAIVQVEEGTAETGKGSEEIAKAAEQVSSTSQRCADLAKQVLARIEAVDRQMADLSASNEEIASTSQNVLERARNAARQGHQAQDLGDEASKKMQIVEGIAKQSVEEIEGLNAQMREINNIVKLITDIANQVNLLALNAAIEAARAGEHGRGFAVVAGEVRNLAGEAKSATRHIEQVIDGIQTSSQKTAAAIKSAHSEIETGVSSVNKTIEALNTIISEAEVVAHGLGEIARATEDQANATNSVVQGMAEGTLLTKDTQEQMDDLAALAEEASASTEEIGSAAHEISQMVGDLSTKMQRFRV